MNITSKITTLPTQIVALNEAITAIALDLFMDEIDLDFDDNIVSEAILDNLDLDTVVPAQSATATFFDEAFTADELELTEAEFNTFIYAWVAIQQEVMLLEMDEEDEDEAV